MFDDADDNYNSKTRQLFKTAVLKHMYIPWRVF